MSIQLQFSTADNLGAAAIRWFDHGAFSHVDAVLGDGQLLGARSDVLANVPAGVQIRPPAYEKFSRVLKVTLPASQRQEDDFYAYLRAQLGKPYDEKAILAFVVGRDWRDPNSWFCSELAAAGLEYSHWFAGELWTPANKVAPDDLLLAISACTDLNMGT